MNQIETKTAAAAAAADSSNDVKYIFYFATKYSIVRLHHTQINRPIKKSFLRGAKSNTPNTNAQNDKNKMHQRITRFPDPGMG